MQLTFINNQQLNIAVNIHHAIYCYMTQKEKDGEIKINQVIEKLAVLEDPIKSFLMNEIDFAYKMCKQYPAVVNLFDLYHVNNKSITDTAKANDYNSKGMTKYRDKDFSGAYLAFKVAYLNDKSNINLALNIMQVMLKLLSQPKYQQEFKEMLNMCGQTFILLTHSDQRGSHFKTLFNKLRTRLFNKKPAKRTTNG
jgi:hypothetical protein